MSRDNSRDFPRFPRRSASPFGPSFDRDNLRDERFRTVLPTNEPKIFDQDATEPKIFDQDAPANLDREETFPETHTTPNWLTFGVGDDDILLPSSRSSNFDSRALQPQIINATTRIWKFRKKDSFNVHGILCPKIAGACEDAPPIFVTPRSTTRRPTTIGVLDGLGGAGAGLADFNFHGQSISASEALLASRIVRSKVERTLTAESAITCDGLERAIREELRRAESVLKLGEKSRIRGTMTKRLPTTLVVSQVHDVDSPSGTKIETWWAGDSRAFLVTPEDGLVLMTRDHVKTDDPLEQLRSDPPIENVVNISTDFYLDEFSTNVKGPFLLLLATDGVFGYLPTPGYLELGLIESLIDSKVGVAEHFAKFCNNYAADDVSAVLLTKGFADDAELKNLFSPRLDLLRKRYACLSSMAVDDPGRNAEIERLWVIERTSYLRLSGVTSV